jgi:DNA-directed RNA polymerase II subunit RPB1
MLGHQFAYSAAPVRKVREVQFGILSPEEIVCIQVLVLHSHFNLY